MKKANNKTLHLVLKCKWWDMIASDEKKEEYRSISDYWVSRLIDGEFFGTDTIDRYKPYENVCFHLGYTNTTMTFRIARISQGYGNPEWGGGKERVFIISLGERVDNGTDEERKEMANRIDGASTDADGSVC